MISMVPVQEQEHVAPTVRAFFPSIVTMEAPGDQGAVVTGTQGWGVSTPFAAEVAAATWGFAIARQTPKAAMLAKGW